MPRRGGHTPRSPCDRSTDREIAIARPSGILPGARTSRIFRIGNLSAGIGLQLREPQKQDLAPFRLPTTPSHPINRVAASFGLAGRFRSERVAASVGISGRIASDSAVGDGCAMATIDGDGKINVGPLVKIDTGPGLPSELCWLSISPDDRMVYATNFGYSYISSYHQRQRPENREGSGMSEGSGRRHGQSSQHHRHQRTERLLDYGGWSLSLPDGGPRGRTGRSMRSPG